MNKKTFAIVALATPLGQICNLAVMNISICNAKDNL